MRARTVVVLLVGALACYLLVVGDRGLTLIRDGRPPFVLLGVGVLLLPLVGLYVVAAELRFGRSTERLARDLDDRRDGVETLPRRPSGRVDRAAARAVFDRRAAEVEQARGDWRAWHRLAEAYASAGDRPRARRAMRHAIALHDHDEEG